MSAVIPESYSQWKHCITVHCGIALSESYVRQRLQALENPHDHMTSGFIKRYGKAHLQQTQGWFQQALSALEAGRTP